MNNCKYTNVGTLEHYLFGVFTLDVFENRFKYMYHNRKEFTYLEIQLSERSLGNGGVQIS